MTILEHEHTWLNVAHEEENRIYTKEEGSLFGTEESFCMSIPDCHAGLVRLGDGQKGIIDNVDVDVANWHRPMLPKDYEVVFIDEG